MAQYQHLPLYKVSYNLLLELMHITKNFPRDFKYSLGEKIQSNALELVLGIYRANSAENKTVFIKDMLEKIQLINTLLRISYDLKILSVEKYTELIEKTSSVSKQAQGWLNSAAA